MSEWSHGGGRYSFCCALSGYNMQRCPNGGPLCNVLFCFWLCGPRHCVSEIRSVINNYLGLSSVDRRNHVDRVTPGSDLRQVGICLASPLYLCPRYQWHIEILCGEVHAQVQFCHSVFWGVRTQHWTPYAELRFLVRGVLEDAARIFVRNRVRPARCKRIASSSRASPCTDRCMYWLVLDRRD